MKVALLCLIISANIYGKEPTELAILSNQVQHLLKIDSEMLNTDAVKHLYEKIINNRQHYSNDVIAKVFLLSARVASNQGDINKVSFFAEKGLAANSLDKTIKSSLLLKLAEVSLAQKQYKDLLELTHMAMSSSKFSHSVKYNLLSLSYRSVAFAMLGEHQQALANLKKVEQGINGSELTEHIELLTILSLAYHHLSDYQTSLTMQLKILKLRFEMNQKKNIAQTYLYLGYAYFYLLRFDDAYNAFWESKRYAQDNNTPINTAYANKGLGLVLLKQHRPFPAIAPLQQAINIFQKKEMTSELIESTAALAKANLGVQKDSEAYVLLKQILMLLNGKDISTKYSGFYGMVAEMHFAQKNYPVAYYWREKYSDVLLEKLENQKKTSSLVQRTSHLVLGATPINKSIEASKKLAVKLAESSELSSSFVGKYQKQRVIIISLSALTFILLLTLVGFFLRLRAQRIHLAYEEAEKPSYVIASPIQTKFDYQLCFKKARKYQYSLCVGYLIIENWEELDFHFNKKNIGEVTKEIASTINEQLTEFDYAGLLNKGEYLLLFEHQNLEEVTVKLDKLVQAVNVRAFANLGDFSITMKYSLNAPDFKDIDPYLFLARIAESVNIEKINQSPINQSQVNQIKAS
jgi:tetratricopeptide (TPR) repeat protein